MKKIIAILFFITFVLGLYYYKDELQVNFFSLVSDVSPIDNGKPNKYARSANFEFVQTTDVKKPTNKQELYNLYYTLLDGGHKNYQFYCDLYYEDCLQDVNDLSRNDALLSDINSFVSPFNSFKEITTSFNNHRLVTVVINPTYALNDIELINQKVTTLENSLITPSMNELEKIRAVHDYLINTTIYDKERANNSVVTYRSDTAYGVLFEGYGICSGYTDAMAIFLNRWGIPNYKITSAAHVWNLVYLNGEWLHLDLTFDDPVSKNGINTLSHNYFLINTTELRSLNDTEHAFDPNVFSELK